MPQLTRRELHVLTAGALLSAIAPRSGRSSEISVLPFLQGVNFAGLSDESWSQPPPEGAVDYYIRQKKMNVVRLNFPWQFLQPQLNGPLDDKNTAIVEEQVKRITGAGAHVILEFHNYNRRTVDGAERIIGEHPSLTSAHFSDAWTKMALQWKNNDKVIFELMNEPHDCDTAILVRVSNDAIKAIRATGAKNLIMLCGNDWNSMGWRAGSSNQTHMLDIVDPLDHFCFDVHHYFDDWSQGKTHNVRQEPVASMKEFTDWAKKHGKKGFCGEFGCSVGKRGMDACNELLEHIKGNPDVYLGWAWWGGGGPWQPDYEFLLDPFASYTSRTNPDPEGSMTWKDPVDRPQMKLLQKFLPADATPFNAWLMEDALAGHIEAAYRHGDFLSVPGNGFEELYLYWCWLWLHLKFWLGLGLKLPLISPAETRIWLDSGAKQNHAKSLASEPSLAPSTLKADLEGGVSFERPGEFLVSNASLSGKRIYAVIAKRAPSGAESAIVAVDDHWGNSGYRLSLSFLGRSANSIESSPSTGPSSKPAKHLVEAYPVGAEAQTSADWMIGLDTSEVQRVSIETEKNGLLVIGAGDIDGGEPLGTTLYDLIILADDISDTEHRRVQGRLYWDLGIAHLLPQDHPYRRRPPATDAR